MLLIRSNNYKIINKLIIYIIDLDKSFKVETNVFDFAFGR